MVLILLFIYLFLNNVSPGQMTFLTSLEWITMRKKKRREML